MKKYVGETVCFAAAAPLPPITVISISVSRDKTPIPITPASFKLYIHSTSIDCFDQTLYCFPFNAHIQEMSEHTLQHYWDWNTSQMDCGRLKLLGLHYVPLCGLKGFHLLNPVSLRKCVCIFLPLVDLTAFQSWWLAESHRSVFTWD